MTKNKTRPGIMFYFELVQPLLSQLSNEQAGQLFRAAFDYAQHGIRPSFEPGMLGMAWALVQPAIDRDGERYNDTILQRKYAVYVREQKRNGVDAMPFEDFKRLSDNDTCHSLSADNGEHRPMTDDNGRHPTTNTTATTKAEAVTASNTKTKSISSTPPTSVSAATTSADIESDQPISTDKPYVWEDTPEGREAQAEFDDDLPF